MSVEISGRTCVRHSFDNGRSWGEPIPAATFDRGSAANPELLVRRDGSIWLLYNERPRDGSAHFSIRLTISRDGGQTWTARDEPIFVAGTRGTEGCWEPSAIELPDGEILVFFANEFPYPNSAEQEITLRRSPDGGVTFTPPIKLAFRAGARDGMPVPLRLEDGSIAIAIEDSHLTGDRLMKPVILWLPMPIESTLHTIEPGDANRWPAVERDWPGGVYAGAPYLARFPGGTTILSVQSTEFGREQRMVVYVGDEGARHFTSPTQPFPVDQEHSGKWNAIFVKNANTVTAISGTTIGGRSGIWTIDGHVRR